MKSLRARSLLLTISTTELVITPSKLHLLVTLNFLSDLQPALLSFLFRISHVLFPLSETLFPPLHVAYSYE